ncbi:MAG: hypothetical protein HZA91_06915 [Verrucomicrobia bacterium]|nr:hypothetical protein [Verrucomicrobiota bacterium]
MKLHQLPPAARRSVVVFIGAVAGCCCLLLNPMPVAAERPFNPSIMGRLWDKTVGAASDAIGNAITGAKDNVIDHAERVSGGLSSYREGDENRPDPQQRTQDRIETIGKDVKAVNDALSTAEGPGRKAVTSITDATQIASNPNQKEQQQQAGQYYGNMPGQIVKAVGDAAIKAVGNEAKDAMTRKDLAGNPLKSGSDSWTQYGVRTAVGKGVDAATKPLKNALDGVTKPPTKPADDPNQPPPPPPPPPPVKDDTQPPPKPPPTDSSSNGTLDDAIATAVVLSIFAGVDLNQLNDNQLLGLIQVAAAINRPNLGGTSGGPPQPTDPNAPFRASNNPAGNEPPGGIQLGTSDYVPVTQPGESPGMTTSLPGWATTTPPSGPTDGSNPLPGPYIPPYLTAPGWSGPQPPLTGIDLPPPLPVAPCPPKGHGHGH